MRTTEPLLLATLLLAHLATAPAFAKGGARAPHINPPKAAHRSEPKPPHINPPKMAHHAEPKPHHAEAKPHHAEAKPHPAAHAGPTANLHNHGGSSSLSIPFVYSSPPRGYSGGHRRGSYHRYSGRHHYYTRHFRSNRYPVRTSPAMLLVRARHQRLMRIKRDLDGMRPGTTPSQAQRARLSGDLMAVAEGPARPGQAPVRHLAANLAEAMGRRRPGRLNSAGMALYLGELMNGAGTAPANFRPALARGTSLLRAAGIPPADAEVLAGDFRDILAALNPDAMTGRHR